MDFIQASQNGVLPPDEPNTKESPNTIIADSSSTFFTEDISFRTICTVPFPKDVPVKIYSEYTDPADPTTSTSILLGEATFDGAVADFTTSTLATGTHVISAVWDGEARWKGFETAMTTTIEVKPGFPIENFYITLNQDYTQQSSNTATVFDSETFYVSGVITNDPVVRTGTIEYYLDGTLIQTVNVGTYDGFVTGNSHFTYFSTAITSTGTYTLSAKWSGGILSDGHYYQTKRSNNILITVTKHNMATDFVVTYTPNPGVVDEPVKFTISNSTSTNLAGTTGNLHVGTDVLPFLFGSGNQAFAFTTPTTVGISDVTAEWFGGTIGGEKYNSKVSSSTSFVVNSRGVLDANLIFSVSPTTYSDHQSITLTATLGTTSTATAGSLMIFEKNIQTETYTTSTVLTQMTYFASDYAFGQSRATIFGRNLQNAAKKFVQKTSFTIPPYTYYAPDTAENGPYSLYDTYVTTVTNTSTAYANSVPPYTVIRTTSTWSTGTYWQTYVYASNSLTNLGIYYPDPQVGAIVKIAAYRNSLPAKGISSYVTTSTYTVTHVEKITLATPLGNPQIPCAIISFSSGTNTISSDGIVSQDALTRWAYDSKSGSYGSSNTPNDAYKSDQFGHYYAVGGLYDPVVQTTATTTSTSYQISSELITATVVNNVATAVVPAGTLTAGPYYLSALWAGTATAPKYYAKTSNEITVTVLNRYTPTATVTLDKQSFLTYDQVTQTINTATVLATVNFSSTVTPTGTVSWIDTTNGGSKSLGTSTIVNGSAILRFTPDYRYGPADYSIKAVYNGDVWNGSAEATAGLPIGGYSPRSMGDFVTFFNSAGSIFAWAPSGKIYPGDNFTYHGYYLIAQNYQEVKVGAGEGYSGYPQDPGYTEVDFSQFRAFANSITASNEKINNTGFNGDYPGQNQAGDLVWRWGIQWQATDFDLGDGFYQQHSWWGYGPGPQFGGNRWRPVGDWILGTTKSLQTFFRPNKPVWLYGRSYRVGEQVYYPYGTNPSIYNGTQVPAGYWECVAPGNNHSPSYPADIRNGYTYEVYWSYLGRAGTGAGITQPYQVTTSVTYF